MNLETFARAAVGALEAAQRLGGARQENEAIVLAAMKGVLPDLGSDYREAIEARERSDADELERKRAVGDTDPSELR